MVHCEAVFLREINTGNDGCISRIKRTQIRSSLVLVQLVSKSQNVHTLEDCSNLSNPVRTFGAHWIES